MCASVALEHGSACGSSKPSANSVELAKCDELKRFPTLALSRSGSKGRRVAPSQPLRLPVCTD